jgi:hypothetical protein
MKNKIITDGEITYIEVIHLKKEIFNIIIDTEDLDKIIKFDRSWYVSLQRKDREYYAYCTFYNGKINGKYSYNIYGLHQFIMDILSGDRSIEIDHINHNRLDNRKENLRPTSGGKNQQNRQGKNSNNKSGYRNVCLIQGYYRIQLQINKKNHLFPDKFTTAEEANEFAITMRELYYGEFAGESK